MARIPMEPPAALAHFAPDSGRQFFLVNGAGHVDMPFAIPDASVENGEAMAHTRIGWFRAVSNVPRASVSGSFVGELAAEESEDDLAIWLD